MHRRGRICVPETRPSLSAASVVPLRAPLRHSGRNWLSREVAIRSSPFASTAAVRERPQVVVLRWSASGYLIHQLLHRMHAFLHSSPCPAVIVAHVQWQEGYRTWTKPDSGNTPA